MTADDYKRAGELFDQLREVPTSEQLAALDHACAGNEELRSQVLRLIEADRNVEGNEFLKGRAIFDAARLIDPEPAYGPAAGTVIGDYRLGKRIGAGGMGVVFEGQDLRLHRKVAIKILPDPIGGEGLERVKRFEREARATSALTHPNIVSVYDAGYDQNCYYIAMELVEGQTVRDLISKQPQMVDQALILEVVGQAASALSAAHEAGILHRDIKPENIMVRPDGFVKVLDFGLAKLREHSDQPVSEGSELHTRPGHLAGTIQYLSPEQVIGKPLDARSDVFSLGVVAYELATGKRPFDGPTDGAVYDAILNHLPEAPSTVKPGISRELDVLILQALEKDRDLRFQTASDLRSSCKRLARTSSRTVSLPSIESPAKARARSSRLAWAGVAVMTAVSVLLGTMLVLERYRQPAVEPHAIHFAVPPPANTQFAPYAVPLVSPDGEKIAFSASPTGKAEDASIWLYRMSSGEARPLPSTDKVVLEDWSPDSNYLAFRRANNVSKIDINSGAVSPLLDESRAGTPTTIRAALELGGSNFGARSVAWGPGGMLFGAISDEGLTHYAEDGSQQRTLPKGKEHYYPVQILPGGREFLFESDLSGEGASAELRRGSVRGGDPVRVMAMDSPVYYSPPGFLVFLKLGTLVAQPFDLKNGLQGQPVPLVNGVMHLRRYMYGAFSVSQQGVLAYRPGTTAESTRLTWFDRKGKVLGTVGEAADYTNPALSKDEKRVAVGIRDPRTSRRSIWVFDLERGSSSRLTFEGRDAFNPVWSPDGTQLAFTSDTNGVRDLYIKSTGTGNEELLLSGKGDKNAEQWSPDGRYLVYNYINDKNGRDLRLLPMTGGSRAPVVYLSPPYRTDQAQLSPDGHWMAYRSFESGVGEVYIQPFPANGQKWQISSEGGSEPQWRGDGQELFYYSGIGLVAVPIQLKGNAVEAGSQQRLFDVRLAPNSRNRWLVSRDGQRVLVAALEEDQKSPLQVVVNWPALMKK